jgi:transcriptional regulator with XRE-family HTH domain
LLPFSQLSTSVPKPYGQGYSKEPQTIGNHIRNRRLELKLTQKQAGDTIGVHHSTVLAWETGKKVPYAKHLAKIEQFLGYEPPKVKRQIRAKTEA